MKEKRPVSTTPKKTKTTPRKTKTTPKKTMTDSIECEDASPPVPDLRLEAKMSAQVSRGAQFRVFIMIVFSSVYSIVGLGSYC